jgi:hypothetical protein
MLRSFVISLWNPAVKSLIHMSNAWHFISFHFACVTFITPAGKIRYFRIVLMNFKLRYKCWKQMMQMAINISGAHVCCRQWNLHTNRHLKTLTINIFTRTSTFRCSAIWLQRQKIINPRKFQYISNNMQRYTVFYLETALHVSAGTTSHHQERKQLYLQHLVFVRPLMLPAAITAGSWTLSIQQPHRLTIFHVCKTRGC